MIPGHTKFKCNSSFGLIKKLYRKITVDCVDHIIEVIKKSSIAGLNKTQHYYAGKGFQYLDIKSILLGIQKLKNFNIFFLKHLILIYIVKT